MHANITETYPQVRHAKILEEIYPEPFLSLQTPPVWFSESEDSKVSDALSHLAATQGLDNHLLYQVQQPLKC